MRKALLVLVATALIGCVAIAEDGLSGTWRSTLLFDPTPAATFITDFASYLDVDYVAGPVTFGFTPAFYGPVPLIGSLLLDSYGRIGAFAFASNAWFDVPTTTFLSWVTGWWLDVAGIELFGMFFYDGIQGPWSRWPTGFGATFGGMGTSGDLTLAAEVGFNSRDPLAVYSAVGWTDWYVDKLLDQVAGAEWASRDEPMGTWNPFRDELCDALAFNMFTPQVVQTGCCACFSFLELHLTYSFCCLDLTSRVRFTCEGGFDGASLVASDIEIPAWPWLSMDAALSFQAGKQMLWFFSLELGEFSCITPYFMINRGLGIGLGNVAISNFGPFVLDSIELTALHLECTLGDVTFRAGSEFVDNDRWFDRRGLPPALTGNFYPSTMPPPYRNCGWPPLEYDEFFGIIAGGDGCCGGDTEFSVFFWTDDGNSDLLFDLEEIDIDFSFGISENATIRTGVTFSETNGVEELLFGVDISF